MVCCHTKFVRKSIKSKKIKAAITQTNALRNLTYVARHPKTAKKNRRSNALDKTILTLIQNQLEQSLIPILKQGQNSTKTVGRNN